MADSMARIIQLLSVLSDMQSRKQQIALSQAQFDENKKQFARRQGFEEKSEQTRAIEKLLDRVAASSAESRGALNELGRTMGFSEEQTAAIEQFGLNAPQSLQTLRERAAGRGAQPGSTGLDREAYTGAVTGMNQGQVAQSGLQALLGGNFMGQMQANPGMATQMAQGFGQKFATGQTPLAAAQDQAVMNEPGAVRASAMIGTGIQPSFFQAGQLEAESQRLTAQLMSAKALGVLTPEQRVAGATALSNVVEALSKPDLTSRDRTNLGAIANRLSQILELGDMYPTPESATGGRGITGELFGRPGTTPAQPQAPPYFSYPQMPPQLKPTTPQIFPEWPGRSTGRQF